MLSFGYVVCIFSFLRYMDFYCYAYCQKLIKGISPVLFFLLTLLFSLPFMVTLLLILGIPKFTADFFIILFLAGILDTIAAILYYKALSISEISLLAPISSFNPVFVLIFASFLLHENPTFLKLLGIVIIVLGSYLLNISSIKSGIFKPFTKLFSDKGVQLFFITNLIWGLTPVLQKKAIFETFPTTPISVPLIEMVFIIIFLTPFLLKIRKEKTYIKTNIKLLILFGGMSALGQFAAQNAFSLTNVVYSIAIFKLSALFSIILGAVFLKEHNIRERFVGAAVMLAGTILIAL